MPALKRNSYYFLSVSVTDLGERLQQQRTEFYFFVGRGLGVCGGGGQHGSGAQCSRGGLWGSNFSGASERWPESLAWQKLSLHLISPYGRAGLQGLRIANKEHLSGVHAHK